MTNERDALEAIINLLYLIEKHAHDAGKVQTFVRASDGPMQCLVDHLSETTGVSLDEPAL